MAQAVVVRLKFTKIFTFRAILSENGQMSKLTAIVFVINYYGFSLK